MMEPIGRRRFVTDLAAVSAALGVYRPGHSSVPSTAAWHKAPCRLCGVGCGLLIEVANGRAVAVKGDPDSPVGAGLACVKGYLSVQTLPGRDRFTRAMVRRDGSLVSTSLDAALDITAKRLRDAIDRHGVDSVALYGSAQWSIIDAYLGAKLFKGGLGCNNVDTSTRLYGASAITGSLATFGLDGSVGCFDDIDQADVFVLWNINLAETDPVLFSRMLARRRKNPAVRIVDLATRTTRTSYAADQAALLTPDGGLAVANAICQEIVARDWVDHGFLDRHVAFKRGTIDLGFALPPRGVGSERAIDADWAAFRRFLEDYTPERAQELAGISAATVRWLASLYGDRARRVMTIWGPSVHQDVRGSWLNNALYNIHLLTGKIGTPGNGALATTGQPSGGCTVHDAGALAEGLPRGLLVDAEDRRRAAGIWGVPIDRIDARPGRNAIEIFRALERGELRFLWIQATNPMLSLPDLERYRRAAKEADCFIVVSEMYPTATTDIADLVLPAASWIEREGVFGSAERRVQHFAKLIDPPGEATSDARLLIEVARRLGLGSMFPYQPDRELAQVWNEYSRFYENTESELPPLSELEARPGVRWPYRNGAETKRRYHRGDDSRVDATRGEFDFYGHPDHRAWIWLRPHQAAPERPDRDYPLWLTSGGVVEHFGGGAMTRRIATLNRALPKAYVEIHPEDAAAHGIVHGDTVRLTSRRGSLEAEARVDYRSQPPRGLVFVPTFDEGVPVNRLSGDDGCPLSGQPDGRKCAVRLDRVRAR